MILQLLASSSHCLRCRFMLVTPLHSDEWNRPVLVNRGWVPSTWRSDPQFRQQWETSGAVSLEAVTRVSEDPSSFVPQNNPNTGEWFWIDIPAMATALGLPMDTPLVEVECNFYLCVIAENARVLIWMSRQGLHWWLSCQIHCCCELRGVSAVAVQINSLA